MRVTFDKNITVRGSPTLKLEVGYRERFDSRVPFGQLRTPIERAATRDATARNDRPDRALIFSYQVQADDLDGNGITIRNDALTGGSIQGNYTYEVHIETPGGDATTLTFSVQVTADLTPAFAVRVVFAGMPALLLLAAPLDEAQAQPAPAGYASSARWLHSVFGSFWA